MDPAKDRKEAFQRMEQVYGTALPARLEIERQLLSRPGRLPGTGVPSSNLGLESATGSLDRIDVNGKSHRRYRYQSISWPFFF